MRSPTAQSVFILFFLHDFAKSDFYDKCDQSREKNFALSARYSNLTCLFEVWGIRKKVNLRLGEEFLFDWNTANTICQFFNATLPKIDSEEKERFLFEISNGDGAFALGVRHTKNGITWENGEKITYSNKNWRRLPFSYCQYTLLVQNDGSTFWEDVPCNSSRQDHVIVFCEESYTRPVLSQFPEFPWDPNDKCDPMNEHKFRRVGKFGLSCYFEVEGIDDLVNAPTNVKEHGISYFKFDIEVARKICTNHTATLPILRSEEEEKFLSEFIGQNVNYIALGLKESENGYIWDDGTPVTYSNSDWQKMEKQGPHYTLLVSNLQEESFWIDVPSEEPISNGVQAICVERSSEKTVRVVGTTKIFSAAVSSSEKKIRTKNVLRLCISVWTVHFLQKVL